MYEAVQHCKHCGAGLAIEDLRLPNCKYCKTVFPHHAQAAQHAQVASQVMGQMLQQQGQIQDQWRGAFGVGPMPPGAGPGGPPGGPPPGAYGAPFGAPFGAPAAYHQAGLAQAKAVSRVVTIFVVVTLLGVFAVVGLAVAMVLLR